MKTDVVEYIARCMDCQKVKVDPLHILEWKWDVVTMVEFIRNFPKKISHNDSIMVVV